VASFTPQPLYSRGKSPRYPLDRRLGGPQSRSGRLGEEKFLDPTGTRTPIPQSSSQYPVHIPTTLSRILNKIRGKLDIFDLQKSGDGRKPIARKVRHSFLFEGLCEKIHVCFDLDVTKGRSLYIPREQESRPLSITTSQTACQNKWGPQAHKRA
jgi:hypothetical protein